MPSTVRLCCSLLLLLGVVSPAGADTQPQGGGFRPRTLLAPVAAPRNPYGTLFLLPGQKTTATAPRLRAASTTAREGTRSAPTVVCGTRLVPIDPTIDPGIRRVPEASAPRPAVRAVEPTLCR